VWVWIYFVSFIVLVVFFASQLFVAVVSENLNDAFNTMRSDKKKKKKMKKILNLEANEIRKEFNENKPPKGVILI
jgi:hypothetical protein